MPAGMVTLMWISQLQGCDNPRNRSNSLCSVTKAVLSCFLTKFLYQDTPLLTEEGWPRHQEDVAKPPFRSGRGGGAQAIFQKRVSETSRLSDHPVSAASEASRHYLSGGATPPP